MEDIRQRYERAARWTAPKLACSTLGTSVDGYWLDNTKYFFLDERVDSALQIIAVPCIADALTSEVRDVIAFDALARTLSRHEAKPIDVHVLSRAIFDMPDPRTLAVMTGEWEYLVDVQERTIKSARRSLSRAALYSPNGRYACYVQGNDLWLRDFESGTDRPLTRDGVRHWSYGQESETCLAAISYREHPYPLGVWSRDSQWFLTQRIDECSVAERTLVQHAPPGKRGPTAHTFKCSTPLDEQVPTGVYVALHIPSGSIKTFEGFEFLAPSLSPFFLHHAWFGVSGSVWMLRTDRYWKQAELVHLDLAHGTGRIVVREAVRSGYLEFHPNIFGTPNVRVLEASGELIWFSERDGSGHLYLYDLQTGKLKNQITRGSWLVRDLVQVDESRREILFLAGGLETQADRARRALCRIAFDGRDFEVLLRGDGDIFVAPTEPTGVHQGYPFRPAYAHPGVSSDGRNAIVRYGNPAKGARVELVRLDGGAPLVLARAAPAESEVRCRHFRALAADGTTPLFGVMFLPSDFSDARRYPLIDYIYPGPHLAHQPQTFRTMNSAPAQALAELGFATIMLDTRSTPIGNREFHQGSYPALQEPQLADHVAVVRQLCDEYTFIDRTRVGIIGFSAGGSAAVQALCRYGSIFHLAVGVCPFNDVSVLASCWADKYRGGDSREQWPEQAISAAIPDMTGKLLLIGSDLDENCPMSETLSIVDVLIRENRDFDLLIVPNDRHYVLLANGYVQRRIWDYLVQNLLAEKPPVGFALRFEPHELARFEKRLWAEYRQ